MGLSVMSMMTFCWEECYVPNHRPLPAPESCRCPLAHPSIQFGEVAASQMKWCHSYTGDPLELDSMVFFEEFNPTLVITNFKVISFHYQTVSNVQGLVPYDNTLLRSFAFAKTHFTDLPRGDVDTIREVKSTFLAIRVAQSNRFTHRKSSKNNDSDIFKA